MSGSGQIQMPFFNLRSASFPVPSKDLEKALLDWSRGVFHRPSNNRTDDVLAEDSHQDPKVNVRGFWSTADRGRPLDTTQASITEGSIFNLQTTLWVCSKRVQRVEIRIGRLNTRTVMERARGDQNIRGGNGYPLGTCATRQIKRRCPHTIINLQFGKCSFQISKYRTLTLGPRAIPKFEPNERTPTRLAFREHTFDPSPNFFITLRPQEMNP
jgi:hypothetical protein